jgi:hypothetical protein
MPVDLNTINPGWLGMVKNVVDRTSQSVSVLCVGLLQFCLHHLDAPTFDTGAANAPRRDPADWVWLRNVIESLESASQVAVRLCEQLRHVDLNDAVHANEIATALEELQEYGEDFDQAQHLAKLAAADITRLLEHASERVRGNAAHVIATCALQNVDASRPFLAANVLNALLARLRVETEAFAASKLLSAVSAVCGDDASTLQQFVARNGVPSLRTFLLLSHSVSVRAKTLFVVGKLCQQSPTFADAVRQSGEYFLAPVVAALAG